MGESSQKPIKIDGVLWEELDNWLKTKQAKKSGFHSKAQFATEAIREHLEQKMKGGDDEYSKIVQKLNSIESKLNNILEKQSGTNDNLEQGKRSHAKDTRSIRTNQPLSKR